MPYNSQDEYEKALERRRQQDDMQRDLNKYDDEQKKKTLEKVRSSASSQGKSDVVNIVDQQLADLNKTQNSSANSTSENNVSQPKINNIDNPYSSEYVPENQRQSIDPNKVTPDYYNPTNPFSPLYTAPNEQKSYLNEQLPIYKDSTGKVTGYENTVTQQSVYVRPDQQISESSVNALGNKQAAAIASIPVPTPNTYRQAEKPKSIPDKLKDAAARLDYKAQTSIGLNKQINSFAALGLGFISGGSRVILDPIGTAKGIILFPVNLITKPQETGYSLFEEFKASPGGFVGEQIGASVVLNGIIENTPKVIKSGYNFGKTKIAETEFNIKYKNQLITPEFTKAVSSLSDVEATVKVKPLKEIIGYSETRGSNNIQKTNAKVSYEFDPEISMRPQDIRTPELIKLDTTVKSIKWEKIAPSEKAVLDLEKSRHNHRIETTGKSEVVMPFDAFKKIFDATSKKLTKIDLELGTSKTYKKTHTGMEMSGLDIFPADKNLIFKQVVSSTKVNEFKFSETSPFKPKNGGNLIYREQALKYEPKEIGYQPKIEHKKSRFAIDELLRDNEVINVQPKYELAMSESEFLGVINKISVKPKPVKNVEIPTSNGRLVTVLKEPEILTETKSQVATTQQQNISKQNLNFGKLSKKQSQKTSSIFEPKIKSENTPVKKQEDIIIKVNKQHSVTKPNFKSTRKINIISINAPQKDTNNFQIKILKTEPISIPKQKKASSTIPKKAQDVIPAKISKLKNIQLSDHINSHIPAFKPIYPVIPNIPKINPPIKSSSLNLSSLPGGLQKAYKKRRKLAKNRQVVRSTLASVILGKKGKTSKMAVLTGLGDRPMKR